MDIRSLYLEYVEKLKEKKEFNVWRELLKATEKKEMFVFFMLIPIIYKICIEIELFFRIIPFLIGIIIYLIYMNKKEQKNLLKIYKNFSDDRRKILFEILKNKTINKEKLEKIKYGVEKIREKKDIFAYPIKIKSISGYILLSSIVFYGSFSNSMFQIYWEKKLEEKLTVENLIFVIFISFLIVLAVVLSITLIIIFFSTLYSFFRLRYYDYLIEDLENAIIFNEWTIN